MRLIDADELKEELKDMDIVLVNHILKIGLTNSQQ